MKKFILCVILIIGISTTVFSEHLLALNLDYYNIYEGTLPPKNFIGNSVEQTYILKNGFTIAGTYEIPIYIFYPYVSNDQLDIFKNFSMGIAFGYTYKSSENLYITTGIGLSTQIFNYSYLGNMGIPIHIGVNYFFNKRIGISILTRNTPRIALCDNFVFYNTFNFKIGMVIKIPSIMKLLFPDE